VPPGEGTWNREAYERQQYRAQRSKKPTARVGSRADGATLKPTPRFIPLTMGEMHGCEEKGHKKKAAKKRELVKPAAMPGTSVGTQGRVPKWLKLEGRWPPIVGPNQRPLQAGPGRQG